MVLAIYLASSTSQGQTTMLQFTDSLTIAELEHQLLRIENNPDSYKGGSKAFYSGYRTEYKPAVQRKVNKLKKQLDALYDLCEA